MGFCGISADNTGFVLATYFVAILPWSVLAFWDPIDRRWKPYWEVWCASWIYMMVSIVPFFMLIPRAILQGCSRDGDIKELSTSVVAMLASLWNIRRAIRGLLALREVRKLWERVDYDEFAPCFHDWLSKDLFFEEHAKIAVTDLLISNALVDNDWPGEAPQVPHIWKEEGHVYFERYKSFPAGYVVESDRIAKQCVVVLWVLWMTQRRIRTSAQTEKSYFLVDPPTSSSFIGRRLRALCDMVNTENEAKPSTVAQTGQCSCPMRFYECPCPARRYWSFFRPRISSTLAIYGWNKHEEANNNETFEIRNQFSKLPPEVQERFMVVTPERIFELLRCLEKLDQRMRETPERKDCRHNCSGSRIGYVLGLSKLYDETVCKWLLFTRSWYDEKRNVHARTDGSEHEHFVLETVLQIKMLAFIALVAAQGLCRKETEHADSCSWLSTRDLYQVGRIVRSIRMLIRSGTHSGPLDILQVDGNGERWTKFLNNIIGIGDGWSHERSYSKCNIKTREALESFLNLLVKTEMPVRDGISSKFLPSHVSFHFEEDVSPSTIWSSNAKSMAAKDADRTHDQYWDEQYWAEQCWAEQCWAEQDKWSDLVFVFVFSN